MNSVRWTSSAVEDLRRVSAYVEQQRNLATANRVCREIYEAVQVLRRYPESGKIGVEEGTRELVVAAYPSYVVIYRILLSEAIQVIRILHGAQERKLN